MRNYTASCKQRATNKGTSDLHCRCVSLTFRFSIQIDADGFRVVSLHPPPEARHQQPQHATRRRRQQQADNTQPTRTQLQDAVEPPPVQWHAREDESESSSAGSSSPDEARPVDITRGAQAVRFPTLDQAVGEEEQENILGISYGVTEIPMGTREVLRTLWAENVARTGPQVGDTRFTEVAPGVELRYGSGRRMRPTAGLLPLRFRGASDAP